MRTRLLLLLSAACAFLFVSILTGGCSGEILDGKAGTGDPPGKPDLPTGKDPSATPPGELRLLRLTKDQYINTLKDLVDDSGGAEDLPFDGPGDSGFYEPSTVGALEARKIKDVAESAAAKTVQNLSRLMGCDPVPAANERACVDSFLPAFGKRAFRRPLVPAEQTALRQAYDGMRALSASPADAIAAVIAIVLQTPSFLYRWELGPQAATANEGVIALNPYEIASRLSYFIWSSMPDQELFMAADTGALRDSAQVAKQARRMLESPKAQSTFASFHDQWLGAGLIASAEKDPTRFPAFTPELRSAMAAETQAFIAFVFSKAGDAKLGTLFGANFSFINEPLAKLYGVSGPKGEMLSRVNLDPAQRFGLLTHASLLSVYGHPDETHPVKRGLLVRERLLCQHVPPPPNNVKIERPIPDPKVSVREQFAQHSQDPACSGCHRLMDPVGFAFESYDSIGSYRTNVAGKAIETAGTIVELDGEEHSFVNVKGLVELVLGSDDMRRCVASQWLRFALGRKEEAGDDRSLEQAQAAFAAADFDIRELIVAITKTTAFRSRSPSIGEITQ